MNDDALIASVVWLRALLTGTAAVTVAILAVATLGILMLSGRLELRRGVRTLIGCFVLFGATALSAGIVGAGQLSEAGLVVPPAPISVSPINNAHPALPTAPYDPYAGASVPQPGYDPRSEGVPR